jgi:hypothetical protein
MGHAQLYSKFPGEEEAAVNLLSAAIYNRLYGMDLDQAFGESNFNQPYITRDQAAMHWMVTPNFRAGNPMDISNTTKDEVRYQHRGYGKYIEMAALFGWEALDSFFRKENLDFIAQAPGDGLSEVDSRILRFSKTTGADMRPLIHFWGVHPQNAAALKSRIQAENLPASKLICDRLTHYKAILPANNAQFVAHGNVLLGGSIPPGGDPDYGSGWYNIWKNQYNTSHGTLGKQALQNIIDLYFPGGCPVAAPAPVVSVTSQSICPGQSATLTASGAMYYQWSNGATGNTITVSPDATTTYTVTGKTAGYASLPVSATVSVNTVPTISVNSETICAGQSATLTAIGANAYAWSTGETGNSISVSPSETTTFTLTGTTAGCVSDAVSATVTVNPVPTVLVNSQTICAGQSATLTANGANTYTWSTGETGNSISVSPSETTTFTLTGTTAGCVSDAVSATVTVNALPIIDLGADIVLQQGQQTVLNANGADLIYLWSSGENTPSIVVNVAGTYSVTVTNAAGCSATDAVLVEIISVTNDPRTRYHILVAPNPVLDILLVTCTGSSTSSAQVIDNLGRVLVQDNTFEVDGATRRLSLAALPAGVYYLRMSSDKFSQTIPITKH